MVPQEIDHLESLIQEALAARSELLEGDHATALRLLNGFLEGVPDLVADLYARTLVLFGHGKNPHKTTELLRVTQDVYLQNLPWVDCVVTKNRAAGDIRLKRGLVTYGDTPARMVEEWDVKYALDLLMNQDASFYLDTRHLRRWLLEKAAGLKVLNTFAYTGSLGVAAMAGGAAHVIQVDRSRKFLALARQSGVLNGLDIGMMKLVKADFFSQVAQLKRRGELFDILIVDPPFFSTTSRGTVDLVNQSVRVINKVRPLIRDGGWLITINNALFLSGQAYMQSLNGLCADGYLAIEEIVPVPEDICGYPHTILSQPPRDPAPFNHSTKITILRVRRKEGRRSVVLD
jgi:23S rRNA (cytosine1962-C5)-methyltransferase